jgi:hypothetical protein
MPFLLGFTVFKEGRVKEGPTLKTEDANITNSFL